MTGILLLAVAALLVLANAFFVASEFAIVKVRTTRLEELAKRGDSAARLALRITGKLDTYLSANQLGITLASLALGWIGEPTVAALLEPTLDRLGLEGSALAHTISLTVAFVSITALHTIVGELAPKSLAIQRSERVALLTARPLHLFYLVMWPVIWLLNACANAFVRLFGLKPARDHETAHSSEELRLLVERAGPGLERERRNMLVRVLDLRRRTAAHVMTLRADVVGLRSSQTVRDAVAAVVDAGYSRYPVFSDDGRDVVGYVHMRDLFEILARDGSGGESLSGTVGPLAKAPLFAVDETSVDRLRRRMQAHHTPLAIITSSAGRFIGIVTIEDLLEEIVGEIRDETDEDELAPISTTLHDGSFEVDGRLLVADLEREADLVLEPIVEKVETVGGYVLSRLGGAPHAGDRVACDGLSLVAIDVAGRRVRRVRIERACAPCVAAAR